jgi:phosphate transport system substrate-binding protein
MFKKLFNDEAGVSPIVATLVLVVVAIAGAAAVGTIMGSFSDDVGNDMKNPEIGVTSGELLIAGSTTVQPVSELIAKAYMDEHPGVKITVQAGGSSVGIASTGNDMVDIGSASKYVSDSDLNKYPDLQTHTIGGSAVVVITNAADPGNTSATLSNAELETVYDADTSNGDTIAFDDGVIVYHRSEGSGTEETFGKYVNTDGTKNVDAAVADTAFSNASTVSTAQGNQGVLDAVATTANSIGFVDYGFAKDDDRVTIVPITGHVDYDIKEAVKDSLADEDSSTHYEIELCRPLNYITNGEPSDLESDYIAFAMSPGSLDFFHDAGYYALVELV